MILFTIYGLFTMDMMGMGEKPRKIYKIGGRLFSGPKEPETSRTYPRWDGNPTLQG